MNKQYDKIRVLHDYWYMCYLIGSLKDHVPSDKKCKYLSTAHREIIGDYLIARREDLLDRAFIELMTHPVLLCTLRQYLKSQEEIYESNKK